MASLLHRVSRALPALLASTLLVPTAVMLVAAPAHAETYRFWAYWQVKNDSWVFATTGAGQAHPGDGSVQGWRFTKSSGDSGSSEKPRPEPSFTPICGDTPAKDGKKRVAVVIDYGNAGDAPKGKHPQVPRTACAQVAPDATGTEVVAAVSAESYLPDGRICAVDDYPPNPSPKCGGGQDDSSGNTDSADGSASAAATSGGQGGVADTGGGNGQAAANAASDDAAGGGLSVGAIIGVAVAALVIGVLIGFAVLRTRRAG